MHYISHVQDELFRILDQVFTCDVTWITSLVSTFLPVKWMFAMEYYVTYQFDIRQYLFSVLAEDRLEVMNLAYSFFDLESAIRQGSILFDALRLKFC